MEGVTISKYGGDDLYSWAVFVNNRPVVTGLSREEAQYHKRIIVAQVSEQTHVPRESRKIPPCGCACCHNGFCGGCGHAGCGRRTW